MNISTYWINLRPICKSKNSSNGSKTDHRLYLIQEINANFFKEEITKNDDNKIFVDEVFSKPPEENYETN